MFLPVRPPARRLRPTRLPERLDSGQRYIGLCSDEPTRKRIWKGLVGILDFYKWKLEIHSKVAPRQWYEYLHVRYSPEGREIPNEHWMHNQFDSYGNWLDVCLDEERLDLASLLVDYLNVVKYAKKPSAGAWEDRNTCDAYSLACCVHALQRAKAFLPNKKRQIENMVRHGCKRLYSVLLPYATNNRLVCLSLLGILWPLKMGGPFTEEIKSLVLSNLKREPYGFVRYAGDSYDGEGFSRGPGTEMPWPLGDGFMCQIEPEKPLWRERLDAAHCQFGMMPEAYRPESLTANRNSPLLWAEAMRAACR
jgi:hypothetical protein